MGAMHEWWMVDKHLHPPKLALTAVSGLAAAMLAAVILAATMLAAVVLAAAMLAAVILAAAMLTAVTLAPVMLVLSVTFLWLLPMLHALLLGMESRVHVRVRLQLAEAHRLTEARRPHLVLLCDLHCLLLLLLPTPHQFVMLANQSGFSTC